MNIWCLVSNADDYLEKYGEAITKDRNGVRLVFIDYAGVEISQGTEPAFYFMGKKLEKPDAFWAWTGNTDARVIEHLLLGMGIKSITNLDEQSVTRSKIATYDRLAKAGLPVPRTFVFFNHPDREMIEKEFSYPFVIKPDNGFGGEGVALIHDKKEFDEYLSDLKYGVAYMAQEYISTSRGKDLRVVMLKGECYVSITRQAGSPDEFRSNIHQGGSADHYELDEDTIRLCKKAASLFDLKFLGLDLMFGEDGFVFTEVNSFPGLDMKRRNEIMQTLIGDFIEENS